MSRPKRTQKKLTKRRTKTLKNKRAAILPKIDLMNTPKWTTPDDGLEVYTNIANPGLYPANSIVAGFDLDGTLITTQSGRTFPRNREDWKWLASEIPDKLRRLASSPATLLVIITNQSNFTEVLRNKIEDIILSAGLINVPFIVTVSTEHTRYRKPMRGVMDWLRATYKVASDGGFYVGDAMSPEIGDHSTSDYYFALNSGLAFNYAANYWANNDIAGLHNIGAPIPPPVLPAGLMIAAGETTKTVADKVASVGYDVVILVGAPAVGKTTLAEYLRDYYGFSIAGMDTDGTRTAYIRNLKALLNAAYRPRIVIDNTNPDRTELLEIIKNNRSNAQIGIVWFDVDRETAEYMNHRRCYLTGRWIPVIAYNIYYKKMVPPKGDNVIRFVPSYENVERNMYY